MSDWQARARPRDKRQGHGLPPASLRPAPATTPHAAVLCTGSWPCLAAVAAVAANRHRCPLHLLSADLLHCCLPASVPAPPVGSWSRIENKAVIGEDVFIKVWGGMCDHTRPLAIGLACPPNRLPARLPIPAPARRSIA